MLLQIKYNKHEMVSTLNMILQIISNAIILNVQEINGLEVTVLQISNRYP